MPIDFDAAAAAMFPSQNATAPTTPDAVEHTPMELRMFGDNAHADRQRSLAQRFPGETPQPDDKRAVDELTDAEKGARLFKGTDPVLTYADSAQAIRNAAMENHLADPETAKEVAAQWSNTFAEYELTGAQAKEFADLGVQVMREPPTPQLVATWTETAIADLKATYGVQGAGQALQDARDYIALRGESLTELLDSLGIGSHPAIVRAAAERGRQLRLKGKLK